MTNSNDMERSWYRHKPLVASADQLNGSQGGYPQGGGGGGDEAALDFTAIWDAMRRGKWIILLTTLLIVGGITAYTLEQEPVYEASSLVSIGTDQAAFSEAAFTMTAEHTLPGEVGVLENSVVLAERVVERLMEAREALGTDEHYPLLKEGKGEPVRRLAWQLMDRMSFSSQGAEDMIGIAAESTVPEEAAAIATFYAEEYQEYSQEKSRERIAAARQFLEEQRDKYGAELRSLENQWEAFAREKQVVQQGAAGEQVAAEYNALQKRRDEIRFSMEQEQVSIDLLKQQLSQAKPGLEEQVTRERAASEVESELEVINRQLAELKAEAETYYAVDPSRRNKETGIEELEEVEKRIAHFTSRKEELTQELVDETLQATTGAATAEGALGYVNLLRSRIKEKQLAVRELQAQASVLDERIAGYSDKLQSIPRQNIEREQLERKISQAEQFYGSFVDKLQQVRIAEEAELGYVRLVRSAVVPAVPVRPDVKQNVILGILLGLGFGCGLAFVRSAADQRLNDPEDVEEQGGRLVGVIPDMGKAIKESFDGQETVEVEGRPVSTSLMTLLDPWSPIAENFRLIRTNLSAAQAGGPIKTLLVTSPEQADGKSVAAVNIAIAMAQGGRRTLLIDADLRRPGSHRLLGMERAGGLADLLTGKRAFQAEDFGTAIEGLSFIPAGRPDVPPVELLDSSTMHDLITEMRRHYEAIIIDSPPVLAVTDALVLSHHSDAAVMVVSADKTEAGAMQATQHKLQSVGTHIAGTIINRVDTRKSHSGYGYGYHDRYTMDEA